MLDLQRGMSSISLVLTLAMLAIGFSQLTSLSLLSPVLWFQILPATYVIYRCWIYRFYFSPLRKIPTVPCNPLWVHFFIIIREEAGVPYRSRHKQYGNVIRLFLPFGIEVISVADDEALKQITAKDPYNFPYPLRVYVTLCSLLGKGLLLTQGEAHAYQRKILGPAFANASIKALSPVFWGKALLLTEIWRQEFVSQGKRYRSIDVFEWSRRTTMDVIGEAAFGTNIDSLRNTEAPLHRAWRLATNTEHNLFQGLRVMFRFLKYIPVRVSRDTELSQQIMKREAADIMDCKLKQRSTAPDEKDIMSLILKTNQSTALPESQITLATLKNQVRTFIGAGHETASVAVAWSLLFLAQNPDVQDKLREEIREHMPCVSNLTSRDVAGQEELPDVDHLPYLDSVTRECLRFVPPVPLSARQTRSPTHLESYPISPGTAVWIAINAINRLPCYWGPDADTFDPERWNHLPSEWTPNAYMTFSQGPKSCIARKFAETELKVLLGCLVGRFTFGVDEGDGECGEVEDVEDSADTEVGGEVEGRLDRVSSSRGVGQDGVVFGLDYGDLDSLIRKRNACSRFDSTETRCYLLGILLGSYFTDDFVLFLAFSQVTK